jgi:hypothetical protein
MLLMLALSLSLSLSLSLCVCVCVCVCVNVNRNRVRNCYPLSVELPSNTKMVTDNWNVSTAAWLRMCMKPIAIQRASLWIQLVDTHALFLPVHVLVCCNRCLCSPCSIWPKHCYHRYLQRIGILARFLSGILHLLCVVCVPNLGCTRYPTLAMIVCQVLGEHRSLP